MKYTIDVLRGHRRDLLATANELELRMGRMLDPHTEAAIDQIRTYRVRAEEIGRAIALLEQSNILNMEPSR